MGSDPQNSDSRNHTDKDAQEEFGHFQNRFPIETVQSAILAARQTQRGHGDNNHQQIADNVLQFQFGTVHGKRHAGLPHAGHEHGSDDSEQQQEIDFSLEAEFFHWSVSIARRPGRTFFFEKMCVNEEVNS